jgi:small subunit ribosomal protein S8
MNDPLGDMLTRIRNAQLRGKSTVKTPASKLRAWVLDVLVDEGYIRGYEKTFDKNGHPALEIGLKYFDGTPVIRDLQRVSTPKGVMSDAAARTANVGGEVLCTVF